VGRRPGGTVSARMSGLPTLATAATALGCGLVAGVFFAFSTFVMDALARLPAAQGIEAMQSINRTAVTPLFMTALMGTAAACLALAVWAAQAGDERGRIWVLAGAGAYLLGTLLPTIARNVPLNDALARVNPSDPEAADRWARFVADWGARNHVRGAAALIAAAMLTVALATR